MAFGCFIIARMTYRSEFLLSLVFSDQQRTSRGVVG